MKRTCLLEDGGVILWQCAFGVRVHSGNWWSVLHVKTIVFIVRLNFTPQIKRGNCDRKTSSFEWTPRTSVCAQNTCPCFSLCCRHWRNCEPLPPWNLVHRNCCIKQAKETVLCVNLVSISPSNICWATNDGHGIFKLRCKSFRLRNASSLTFTLMVHLDDYAPQTRGLRSADQPLRMHCKAGECRRITFAAEKQKCHGWWRAETARCVWPNLSWIELPHFFLSPAHLQLWQAQVTRDVLAPFEFTRHRAESAIRYATKWSDGRLDMHCHHCDKRFRRLKSEEPRRRNGKVM